MLHRLFRRHSIPVDLTSAPDQEAQPTQIVSTSDDVSALFEAALEKMSVDDYEAALSLFEKAVDLRPDIPNVWEKYSVVLQKLGRYGEAVKTNAKAMQLYQAGAQALVVDVTKGWSAEKCLLEGDTLFFQRRYEDAIAAYDAALQIKPDLPETLYNKGVSLFRLGRYDEAIIAYDAVLTFKPELYAALNNKGLTLAKLDRYEEAIIAYDNALQLKSDLHQMYNDKGLSLAKLGRYEDAISAYDAALHLQPDKHSSLYNKGLALARLDRHEEAITAYDAALPLSKIQFASRLLPQGLIPG